MTAATIPILDATAGSFAADVIAACEGIGFFAVTGHRIDADLFDTMRQLCADVFAVDEATKLANRISPANYRGFIPLGFFTPNRAEVNGVSPDVYEGFKLHWECPQGHPVRDECDLYGPNKWLSQVPDMQATISEYWLACEHLGTQLLDIVAPELGVSNAELRSWHTEPLTNMTLLHYPPADGVEDPAGIHAHKDTNVFTLLHPDPVGGLEVRSPDGGWINADPPPDAVLVNTGEMIELWSGGRFRATPHRVVNSTGRRRYSFPWFQVPRHDVTVAPLVDCVDGFDRAPMPVGALSAEVWRTNWPDQKPSASNFDLGALDRQ